MQGDPRSIGNTVCRWEGNGPHATDQQCI